MSQTRKNPNKKQQPVKIQERQRQKAEQRTQRRLASLQRKSERTRRRSEKVLERSLSNAESSPANEAFAEGLESYRYYHDQQIVNTILQKGQEKLDNLPPNSFYLINKGRFLPLSFIAELDYFGVLYKDENPENSYYFFFSEEEDYEDDETHQVYYHFEVKEVPPYYYPIYMNGGLTSKLTRRQYRMLFDSLDHDDYFFINSPLAFMYEDPRFPEQYKKSVKARQTGPQKMEHLRERALEKAIETSTEKTGRDVGENVEAKIRSFLSAKPFARNYSGVSQNFKAINTSLFEN